MCRSAGQSEGQLSWTAKFLAVARTITTEPVIFIMCIGFGIGFAAISNLRYFKVCYDVAAEVPNRYEFCMYNGEGGTDELLERIQTAASNFSMVQTVVNAVCAVFGASQIGSWSDKNGRKPALLIALAGQIILVFIYLLMAAKPDQFPLYALLAGEIVAGLCLGIPLILACCISAVMDVVPNANQLTVRTGIAESGMMLGVLVGGLIGGALLKPWIMRGPWLWV